MSHEYPNDRPDAGSIQQLPTCEVSASNKFSENYNLLIVAGEGQNKTTFKTHISVLSKASRYFGAALSKTWLRKMGKYYHFKKPNVEPELFKIILK